eukprot:SAG11_NODE_1048_length_6038_cov_8.260818_2_plen_78_part_00
MKRMVDGEVQWVYVLVLVFGIIYGGRALDSATADDSVREVLLRANVWRAQELRHRLLEVRPRCCAHGLRSFFSDDQM